VHILFTRFPLESALGGAEIQTLSLMKGLIERGHGVSFLGSCPVLLEQCKKAGISCLELSIGPPPVSLSHGLSFVWRRKEMKRLLEDALSKFPDTEAVCMLSLSEKLLLTKWMIARQKKVLWIEHDRVGRWLRKNPWLGQLRRLSKFVKTVTVSKLSRRIYLKLGWPEDRTIAIPNGVDVERLGKPHPGHKSSDHLHLGCIARLTRDKGVDLLVEAIKKLPDVTLDIVGQGPEEGRLLQMIKDRENDDEHETISGQSMSISPVRFFPTVSVLADFYLSHDVIVLPSREHDPFGLVAAEAMMLGVPVIITDVCGIAEYLLDDENVLIAKADSSEALQEAIKKLRDAKLRDKIAAAGKKSAHALFKIDAMVDAYAQILSE